MPHRDPAQTAFIWPTRSSFTVTAERALVVVHLLAWTGARMEITPHDAEWLAMQITTAAARLQRDARSD